jgi:hypothetical protein
VTRIRIVLILSVGLVIGYVGGASVHCHSDDSKIVEVLADENAALKEKVELQRKLIETYEAERQELGNAVNPT